MNALAISSTQRPNACTEEALTAEGFRLFQSQHVLIIEQTDERLERPIHMLTEPVGSFDSVLLKDWTAYRLAPAYEGCSDGLT